MKKTTKKIIASALAATMVMASSAMVFADETTGSAVSTGDAATTTYTELTKCSYSAKTEIKDGIAYVTVSVDGDASAFDFGLTYNADEVEYDTYELTDDFNKAFVKKAKGIITDNDQKDLSYVVIGGTSDECNFSGAALTLAFNLKSGVTAPTITVVKDSKAFLDAYKATSATGTLADFAAKKPFGDKTPAAVTADVVTTPTEAPTESPAATTPAATDNTNNGGTTTTTTTAPATTKAAAATTTKKSPKTGDAGVVLPIVAICGAAAAVAVASKKKVED